MDNHIEIYKAASAKGLVKNRWYWRVVSENGQITATGGEGFYSAWNAKRAATKIFSSLEVKRV